MKYGYVRVSTVTQNIDRQMDEMYKLGLTDNEILSINKVEKISIVKISRTKKHFKEKRSINNKINWSFR